MSLAASRHAHMAHAAPCQARNWNFREGSGHFPFDDPARFIDIVRRMNTTEPPSHGQAALRVASPVAAKQPS